MASQAESFAFNADIQHLMTLIINTCYSNKDIFLGELMSNASCALGKVRYDSITDTEKIEAQSNCFIKIVHDKTKSAVPIEESGMGMTKDELINNLGTITKSGAKAFEEARAAGGDISTIGQFGVGFYSSYFVSDKVQVLAKTMMTSKMCGNQRWVVRSLCRRTRRWLTVRSSAAPKSFDIFKHDQSELVEGRRHKDLGSFGL